MVVSNGSVESPAKATLKFQELILHEKQKIEQTFGMTIKGQVPRHGKWIRLNVRISIEHVTFRFEDVMRFSTKDALGILVKNAHHRFHARIKDHLCKCKNTFVMLKINTGRNHNPYYKRTGLQQKSNLVVRNATVTSRFRFSCG